MEKKLDPCTAIHMFVMFSVLFSGFTDSGVDRDILNSVRKDPGLSSDGHGMDI